MGYAKAGFLVTLAAAVTFAATARGPVVAHHRSAMLPVSTSSAEAKQLFERGMKKWDRLYKADAIADWQAAIRKDPRFALAHLFIAYTTTEPEVETKELMLAQRHASHASRGEQLLIGWVSAARNGQYLPAIAAMNDLLAMYPDDKSVNFLAGTWLFRQERFEQSAMLLEKVVAAAPNYASAINELGYDYSAMRKYEPALAMMERYVALQPDEPNSHDSYGEILRAAGHYEQAIEQYRIAVKLDPQFGSTLGIADTFALMGKEAEARDEYEKALLFSRDDGERLGIELQSAMTYIRESKIKLAAHALQAAAKHAHQAGLARQEAEAWRVLASSEPDQASALRHLEEAEKALSERHPITAQDQEDERALILYTRATRSAERSPDIAARAVEELEAMGQTSRSHTVQRCWHGAAGAVLMVQEKYKEAIPFLEDDDRNPISMQWLIEAYGKTGREQDAAQMRNMLAACNEVTMEQALIVPQIRNLAEKGK